MQKQHHIDTGLYTANESSVSNIRTDVSTRHSEAVVHDEDDRIKVRIDMPGIEPDGLEVTLTGRRLVINYEKASEVREDSPEDGVQHVTTTKETLRRELDLPLDVDPNSVEAIYKRGTLTVTLLKRPLDDGAGEWVQVDVN